MAEQARERTHIDAAPDRCYEVAADFERYPDWARDVKAVEVRRRDDEGRAVEVEFRAAAMGRSVTYVLAYDHSEAPRSFSWTLLDGGRLIKALDGSYRFEPDDSGTRVTYDLSVDLALPLPGLVKRRAEGRIIGAALRELKAVCEAEAAG